MSLKLIQQTQLGLNQEALDDWIAYRREDCKKKMSQRAVDMVIKKLLHWSEEDQQRIVDEGIEREWTGLYWVDPPKGANNAENRLAGNTGQDRQRLTPSQRTAAKRESLRRSQSPNLGIVATDGGNLRPPMGITARGRTE